MSENTSQRVIWIVATAVVAMIAGAGVMWVILGEKVDTLERQVSELEASAEATQPAEATGTAEGVPEDTKPPADDVTEPVAGEPPSEGNAEIQPGLVKGLVNDGGTWKLQIDYVQFLTGAEAAAAATAHGDESPPPNDYYVVNDNPKIREFPVQAGIGVIVVTNEGGGADPGGHAISLSQWASALNGPDGPIFRSTIYWVTVNNGTITAINAQYTP